MLLNIIHPYTYKLKDDTIQIGPCPEYEARDRAVTQFVQKMLDLDSKVLLHLRYDGNKMHHILEEVALHVDPLYKIFLDERIEQVVTTGYGVPLPDQRLEKLSDEQWGSVQNIYTSNAQLQAKMSGHKEVLFMGGILENCITNMASYFHAKYRVEGQDVRYIPELSVSRDEELWTQMQIVLGDRKIYPISVNDVWDRLKLAKHL